MPLKSCKSAFTGMAPNHFSCDIAAQPPFACTVKCSVLSALGCVRWVPAGEITWLILASASLFQSDAVPCLQIKNPAVVLRSVSMARSRSGQVMFWEVSYGSKQLEMNEKLEDVSDYLTIRTQLSFLKAFVTHQRQYSEYFLETFVP